MIYDQPAIRRIRRQIEDVLRIRDLSELVVCQTMSINYERGMGVLMYRDDYPGAEREYRFGWICRFHPIDKFPGIAGRDWDGAVDPAYIVDDFMRWFPNPPQIETQDAER